jgi:hypothetical protein
LIIHPYYTSSIYTQSIVQNYTKAVDGPPPIDVIITPPNITLNADEVGFVSTYSPAQTTIQLREGGKFLTYNPTSTSPGTFRFISSASKNITASLSGIGTTTVTSSFSRFDHPFVSASIAYNILAYPYSLGPGHRFTSSIFERTQNITKNVSALAARSVKLAASSYSVTYDSDGQVVNPTDGITLIATAFNTTGSRFYQFFKDDISQGPITSNGTRTIGPEDAVAAGEIATWKVTLRDGSNLVSAPIRAQDSITITGIKEGIKAYNASLTNENTSIVYTVQGTLALANTGTTIVATKGNTALTDKTTFSAQSQDPFGNNIGSQFGFSGVRYETDQNSKNERYLYGADFTVRWNRSNLREFLFMAEYWLSVEKFATTVDYLKLTSNTPADARQWGYYLFLDYKFHHRVFL